jgi:hypothetical protein
VLIGLPAGPVTAIRGRAVESAGRAHACHGIGVKHHPRNRFDEALETLRGALVLQRAANDRGGRAVTLNSLARRRLRAAASPRPSGREQRYRFGDPEQLEVTFFGAKGAYGKPGGNTRRR